MADGESHEVEWQFDAPDLEVVERWLRGQPPHASLSLEERAPKHQQDTYLDTAEWRLFHAGYSLRERAVGEAIETTLKGLARAGAGPVARVEVSAPGDVMTVAAGASPAAERLRLMLRGDSPRPLFTVTTHRRVWLVRRDADVLAEIAVDATSIAAAGTEAVTLQRVEVEEVLAGGLRQIEAFVTAMSAECALTPAAQSKFETGLTASGLRPAPPDLGSTVVTPDDRAVDRAYAVLRRRGGEFLARESGTALGEDVEPLHDMRVATRRLRAAIRVFDTVLPTTLIEVRDELRWFAQVLGAVRDLDVQIEHLDLLRAAASWEEATALAPLVVQLERQRVHARAALIEALDSARYARLTATLRTALVAGPATDATDTTSREAARRVILVAARSLIAVHDVTFLLGPAFGAPVGNGLLLGWMMYRTGLMPRALTFVGLLGGTMGLISATAVLFGFYLQLSPISLAMTVPEIIWETSLGLLLTFRGFSKPRAEAGAMAQHAIVASLDGAAAGRS